MIPNCGYRLGHAQTCRGEICGGKARRPENKEKLRILKRATARLLVNDTHIFGTFISEAQAEPLYVRGKSHVENQPLATYTEVDDSPT